MRRLHYDRYVSQGGDWGSVVSDELARQAPEGLLGIHVNMPATVPPEIAKALNAGDRAPDGLADDEKAAFEQLAALYTQGSGYAEIMVTRPQTVGYGQAETSATREAVTDGFAALRRLGEQRTQRLERKRVSAA